MSQRLHHRTAHDTSPFIPRLEALEDRLQPSIYFDYAAVPSWIGGNRDALIIGGTDYADTIRITDSGAPGRGGVVVTCYNGLDRVSIGELHDFAEISISTGYGADTVVYELRGDLATSRKIDIKLGDGDDTFTASLGREVWGGPNFPNSSFWVESDLLAGGNLCLNVRGGEGRDTINVFADHGVDIHRNAALSLSLEGQSGNDTIGVYYNGGLDGVFDFLASGGWNDDTVTAHVVLGQGEPGVLGTLGNPIRPQVRDGGGQDSLTYLVQDNSNGEVQILAIMEFTDWGFGDEIRRTPNVHLIW